MEANIEFGRCPYERVFTGSEEFDETFSDIATGSIYFGNHGSEAKHIPFMLTSGEPLEMVLRQFVNVWRTTLPKIVLFIVGYTKTSITEKQQTLKYLLIKGLMTASNTTEMWICTDGLNHGFSKDLGQAVENEVSRRKILSGSMQKMNATALPKTSVIGICEKDSLNFSGKLETEASTIFETKEPDSKDKLSVNKNFNYFVFLKNGSDVKKVVLNFNLNFGIYLKDNIGIKRKEEESGKKTAENFGETPVMILLVHGEAEDIDNILGYLKNGLPIVVIEGSGGLADLVAFAYYQITCRPEGSTAAEYTEVVLKPQLFDKINEYFPDVSAFRTSEKRFCEKIFDCIRHSEYQEQKYITVLTLRELQDETTYFHSHLLQAMFKANVMEKTKGSSRMKKDLFLAMDWNAPDVAAREIFGKEAYKTFPIDDEIFFRALTKPNREKFVSLLLGHGLVVHEFLNSHMLIALFQSSLRHEFFRVVVWETVMGFGTLTDIPRNFIDNKLVILIEELTGIPSLIKASELDSNSQEYSRTVITKEAEQRAVLALTIWGILSYRITLVQQVWKHSEQPVHLALICSVILNKLQKHVTDFSLKNEMKNYSQEFSKMACDLMTTCYSEIPKRALDLLLERSSTFSYKPALEMAAFAKNLTFMAHPCCQKYMDSLFMGKIKVRDLPYGDMTLPLWLKIVLTTFLVFPIFIWIEFDDTTSSLIQVPSNKSRSAENLSSKSSDLLTPTKKSSSNGHLSLWKKIYYLYTAPISKFWVSQVFYIIFLFFFSMALIWPGCGSLYLDFISCLWIAIMVVNSIYNVVTLGKKFPSMNLVPKKIEIALMSVFLICYVMSRIAWYRTFLSPYGTKVMMCLALLYFYYRLIFISFPISPQLGPMLYRIKSMTLIDFMGFMRVTTLVLISNGIVIHATIYPDFPLSLEMFRRAFYDAIISFFLTPAGHFGDPDPTCILLKRHPNLISFYGLPEDVCKVGRYYRPDCPNPGVWPYLFGFQFFFLLKIILMTLLISLFSNTEARMQAEGINIWKYQRYQLIIDYYNRLTFPAPLSPISYCIILFNYAKGTLDSTTKKDKFVLDEGDFAYWKSLALLHDSEQHVEYDEETQNKLRKEKVTSLMNALSRQTRSMGELLSQIAELQAQVKSEQKFLEGSHIQLSLRERFQAKRVPQIFSRISPYPYTNILRVPVSDSRTSWSRAWKKYDPVAYTKPKDDFPSRLQPYVDVDIQLKRELEGEDFRMPLFQWNVRSLSPGGVTIDRQSWIEDEGKPFQYELDTEGLPLNPMGRTGLRGRGSLPRWGPNHYSYIVITQWHDEEMEYFKNHLEVAFFFNGVDCYLPGGFASGENAYEPVQSFFLADGVWSSAEDMLEFFELLAVGQKNPKVSDYFKQPSHLRVARKTQSKDPSDDDKEDLFVFELVQRGYMDESTNTDQAWCEAEVWHVHYNGDNEVNGIFKPSIMWLFLTEDILYRVCPGQASFLHTIVKKMKAVLETS